MFQKIPPEGKKYDAKKKKIYNMSREAPHSLVGRFLYLTRI